MIMRMNIYEDISDKISEYRLSVFTYGRKLYFTGS